MPIACPLKRQSRAARGEVVTATASYVRAAELAREVGDVRRFAEAALGAVGDGVRVGLDATDKVIGLLREAVSLVPAGPTPLRARLLARLAVAQSQFTSPHECAALARTSLAIATAIDDASLVATALHALIYSMPDPLAHAERSALIDQLAELADAHPAERWIRWVLPLEARHRLLIGDVDGALARLGRLAEVAGSDGDVVSVHPANYRLVLAATVAGDWDDARAAAAAVRASSNAALFDEATGAVAYSGMMRMFGMLERKPHHRRRGWRWSGRRRRWTQPQAPSLPSHRRTGVSSTKRTPRSTAWPRSFRPSPATHTGWPRCRWSPKRVIAALTAERRSRVHAPRAGRRAHDHLTPA